MGIFYILLLLGTIIGGAIQLSGGPSDLSATNFIYPTPTTVIATPVYQLVPVTTTSGPEQKNLQVNSVVIATVTPTPTPVPPPPPPPPPVSLVGVVDGPNSCGLSGVSILGSRSGSCCVDDGPASSAGSCCGTEVVPGGAGYQTWCDRKPVIYLYPEKEMNVSVSLQIPGTIPVSIPYYPEGGWQNITAFPDGSFQYQEKSYHELFYETNIMPVTAPKTGIIVARKELATSLSTLVTRLGLLSNERQELLAYWLPQLDDLNSPYIFISVFDQKTKDAIDHVTISPQADTFIQFNLYFHPLYQQISVPPLVLPEPTPMRKGFTAVEWGGIIDK